jgi:hypothetical protein
VYAVYTIFRAVNRHKREVNDFACAKNLGVGLQRPSRGQTCGGILGSMARISPARPATQRQHFFQWLFLINSAVPDGRASRRSKIPLDSPLGETFVVNSEPHTGARPWVRLCLG